jgi:hypothetical protein
MIAQYGSNIPDNMLQNMSGLQNLVTIDPNKNFDSMYVQWAKATPTVRASLERAFGIPHQMIVDYEYWAVQNHKDANSYIKE